MSDTLSTIKPRSSFLQRNQETIEDVRTMPVPESVKLISKKAKIRNVSVSYYLPEPLATKVKKIAKASKLPDSEVVKQALEQFLQ